MKTAEISEVKKDRDREGRERVMERERITEKNGKANLILTFNIRLIAWHGPKHKLNDSGSICVVTRDLFLDNFFTSLLSLSLAAHVSFDIIRLNGWIMWI